MGLNQKAAKRLQNLLKKIRTQKALKALGPRAKKWSIECVLISAAQMTQLNAHYLGKKKTTDILSFPSDHYYRETHGHLGELVICLPVLKKQAKEQRHTVEAELEILLVHGLLHLLGFDHEKSHSAAKRMAKWEALLLGKKPEKSLIARNS